MANLLVIERDDGVREYMQRILLNANHIVVTERTLTSASAQCRADRFDVVVVNASARCTAGELLQLAREVQTVWPTQVLITSGGAASPVQVVNDASFQFLAKPFIGSDLLRCIEAALIG